jgi:hypothetical protein
MTTEKAGGETTVRIDDGRFTISVEYRPVGGAYFADRDGTTRFLPRRNRQSNRQSIRRAWTRNDRRWCGTGGHP